MKSPIDREAVLDAFALETHHDRETLERYLNDYPDLSEELIDLSAELRLVRLQSPQPVSTAQDPGLEDTWNEFLACKPQQAASVADVDLFAHYRGPALVNLAEILNIPRSILTALRDGLVIPSSIPHRFMRRVADATHAEVATVRACLAMSRELPASLAFKSDIRPSRQEPRMFRELVLNTEMTDEQRLLLLQECDEDELD